MKEIHSRTLLLADDDDPFRRRLGHALRERGYQVTEASDGDLAWQAFQAQAFSYAVFDLKMPGLSGMELIGALHGMGWNTRIIVLTGYGSIASALQAIRQGASDYLTKPADADQVDAALQGISTLPENSTTPSLARLEWEHMQRVLHDAGQNISEAARRLGMDRRTLQRKLAKYPPVD